MKKILILIVALGLVPGGFVIAKRIQDKNAAREQTMRAEWARERAALEDAARNRPVLQMTNYITQEKEKLVVKRESPAEILAELKRSKSGRGTDGRKVVFLLESLRRCGAEALPVIRQYLQSFEEVEFDASVIGKGKAARDLTGLLDSVMPVSLRFGLFDVVRQIGGAQGEGILVDALSSTGRAVEVAYLARVLEQMAPGKYRPAVLEAAHELLANPKGAGSKDPLDQNESEYLYGTLRFFNDSSFVAQAQAQAIRPDGKIDKNAVTYLEQALQGQALALAKQLYSDPRVTDPASKEPLARVALKYVGASAEADQFYQQTINDAGLPKNARSNLIEDLNEDGLNYKNLSKADLPLIEKRLAFIEANGPSAMDAVNAAAFKEAYKDLLKMREKAANSQPKLQ
jgi:hypothetical protein